MASFQIPWNTVNTLVGDFVVPSLATQVYQSNNFLKRLASSKKHFSGGRTIQQPVVWKIEGGGGGWFNGADILDTTVRDTIQMAVTQPKSFYIPIVITWDDEKTVMGPRMVKSLVETKGEQARFTAEHVIANDLFNDGTDGKRLTGLQYIFKDFTGGAPGACPSQTYLGITRQGTYLGTDGGTQNNNWWCHQGDNTTYLDTSTSNFDPLTPGKVQGVFGKMWANIQLSAGANRTPTLILGNVGTFAVYAASLTLTDRYSRPQQDSKLYESGVENIKYKKAVFLVDEKCPRSSARVEHLYFINESTLRLYVHEDADFAFEPFRKPHNQMARVAYILWRGELLCIEPRANGVFSSISCATFS